jgi:hypothetical protein
MARIDITATVLGDKELVAALQRMSSHDVDKAVRDGVRYAARGGRTAIAKNIGAHYSLAAGRIKQDVTQPSFQEGGKVAVIRTMRKPITAMQFKAKETRKGLSMSIYRGQRTVVKSGFIAKGKPFKRTGKERYPLDVIHGPSIHAIYTGGKHAQAISSATEERIQEQLEKGILRSLQGMARGFGKG